MAPKAILLSSAVFNASRRGPAGARKGLKGRPSTAREDGANGERRRKGPESRGERLRGEARARAKAKHSGPEAEHWLSSVPEMQQSKNTDKSEANEASVTTAIASPRGENACERHKNSEAGSLCPLLVVWTGVVGCIRSLAAWLLAFRAPVCSRLFKITHFFPLGQRSVMHNNLESERARRYFSRVEKATAPKQGGRREGTKDKEGIGGRGRKERGG